MQNQLHRLFNYFFIQNKNLSRLKIHPWYRLTSYFLYAVLKKYACSACPRILFLFLSLCILDFVRSYDERSIDTDIHCQPQNLQQASHD